VSISERRKSLRTSKTKRKRGELVKYSGQVIATDTGQITELAVKEGMTVTEGQLLLRMTNERNSPGRPPRPLIS
jgi:multidrug efflux pump subunit AcrA (membrane-fusion protein)